MIRHPEFGIDSGFHQMVLATAIETCREASKEMIEHVISCVDDIIKRAIERGASQEQVQAAAVLRDLETISQSKAHLKKVFVHDIHRHLATVAYKPAAETNVTRKRIGLSLEMSGEAVAVMERTEIATAKLAQYIDLHTIERMEILAGYVSTLRGIRKEASALANVFRGDLFATALRKAIVTTSVSDDVAAIWLQASSEPMADGVNTVYEALLQQLERSGVDQAPSRDSITQVAVNEMLAALFERTADPLKTYGFDLGSIQNEAQVLGELNRSANEAERLNQSQLRVLLAALNPYSKETADVCVERAFPGLTLNEQHRSMLLKLDLVKPDRSELTTQIREVCAKTFRVLLQQASQNQRLHPSIRAEILKLQPRLESLARGDIGVIANPEHPIRSFVNDLVRHGMAFETEDVVGYSLFIFPVQEHVRTYLEKGGGSLKELVKLRLKLQTHWDESASRHTNPSGQSDKVMAWAEQRNNVAYHIRKDIESGHGQYLSKAPDFIRQFILGPWTHVMATIELTGPIGGLDTAKSNKIVRGLIYSTNRTFVIRDRATIVANLPTIIRLVKQGCKAIEWDDHHPQCNEFFTCLSALHEYLLTQSKAVISEGRANPTAIAAWVGQAHEDSRSLQAFAEMEGQPEGSLWLTPSETTILGRLEEENKTDADLGPNGGVMPETLSSDAKIDLPIGSWVEIEKDGIPRRAVLQWSNGESQFLFALKGGNNIAMTARQMRRLQTQDKFRVVMSRDVWCQAMEQALDQAV